MGRGPSPAGRAPLIPPSCPVRSPALIPLSQVSPVAKGTSMRSAHDEWDSQGCGQWNWERIGPCLFGTRSATHCNWADPCGPVRPVPWVCGHLKKLGAAKSNGGGPQSFDGIGQSLSVVWRGVPQRRPPVSGDADENKSTELARWAMLARGRPSPQGRGESGPARSGFLRPSRPKARLMGSPPRLAASAADQACARGERHSLRLRGRYSR